MHAPAPPAARTARRWASASTTTVQHAAGVLYRPRRPTATPLYPVVQHHLETFLAGAEEADPLGFGVSAWVERDFRAYLKCGILAHGFARARCLDCGQERLVPYSCRARGVCPSCNARRMAEVAAHLTDHVLPHLPVRQWVLSLPKRLRPYLHFNQEIAGAVLQIFMRALRSPLRRTSPGAPPTGELAALSFPQRFGSSLNPHFHFHVLALDGVFSEEETDGEVCFHEATLLIPEHWKGLERIVQRRVLRAFRRRGLLEEDVVADMLTWQASGGFSVDASVRVEGDDRAGIERLVRYCARGPLALERLHAPGGQEALVSPEARLLYRLPEPDLQGRTALLLSPLELLERLARLIPPPRVHRHRYHGVLAPHARLRPAVVVIGREEGTGASGSAQEPAAEPPVAEPAPTPTSSPQLPGPGPAEVSARPPSSSRLRWAQLLVRIYEVLPLLCPACGGEMKILAFLTEPPVVRGILLHLDLPHRPPPVAPARGPPQAELAFDQTPDFDPTDPEPDPDFAFDQSPPDSWED